jgi:hypothetical protein
VHSKANAVFAGAYALCCYFLIEFRICRDGECESGSCKVCNPNRCFNSSRSMLKEETTMARSPAATVHRRNQTDPTMWIGLVT